MTFDQQSVLNIPNITTYRQGTCGGQV